MLVGVRGGVERDELAARYRSLSTTSQVLGAVAPVRSQTSAPLPLAGALPPRISGTQASVSPLAAPNSAMVSAALVLRVLVPPMTTTALPAEWLLMKAVSRLRLSAWGASVGVS